MKQTTKATHLPKELHLLLNEHKIPTSIVTGNYWDHKDFKTAHVFTFAESVLKKAGYTPTQAKWIVRGIPSDKYKCDFEVTKGMRATYHSFIIQTVIAAYLNKHNNHTFEVGFDLSEFDKERVIKKFNLTYFRDVPAASNKMRAAIDPDAKPLIYQCWTDPSGNIYSSSDDKFGDCWYHGFVFKNVNDAFKFVKWMISQPDFFIKEISLMRNGFGGASARDLEASEEIIASVGE